MCVASVPGSFCRAHDLVRLRTKALRTVGDPQALREHKGGLVPFDSRAIAQVSGNVTLGVDAIMVIMHEGDVPRCQFCRSSTVTIVSKLIRVELCISG